MLLADQEPHEIIPEGALWLGLKQLLGKRRIQGTSSGPKNKKAFIHSLAISTNIKNT